MTHRSSRSRTIGLLVAGALLGLGGALLLRAAPIDARIAPLLGLWSSLPGLPWIGGLLLIGSGLLLLISGGRREGAEPETAPAPPAVTPTPDVTPARDPTTDHAPGPISADPPPTFTRQPAEDASWQPAVPHVVTRQTGPRIVAIGGGTGMPQLLRGLRAHTDAITAIVTVADDGGSSGRLRRQMGLLPPGDFRNNIAALSESEELLTRLFQYRFASHDVGGENESRNELAGHSFGNLFIATMAAVTGSFESGLAESSRVLAVRGRVLPSTLEQVHLCAEVRRMRPPQAGDDPHTPQEEWLLVEGESQIPEANGQIMRVFLKPEAVRAYPEAIRAILQADLIVAGPGSFFTSIMPNLLVPSVRDAIAASVAPSIYLCNVATQPGETDGYTVSDHMYQLRQHAGDAFTMVLANHTYDPAVQLSTRSHWVTLPPVAAPNHQIDGAMISDTVNGQSVAYRLFTGDLVDEERPWRHNSAKLATRLMEVYRNILS